MDRIYVQQASKLLASACLCVVVVAGREKVRWGSGAASYFPGMPPPHHLLCVVCVCYYKCTNGIEHICHFPCVGVIEHRNRVVPLIAINNETHACFHFKQQENTSVVHTCFEMY